LNENLEQSLLSNKLPDVEITDSRLLVKALDLSVDPLHFLHHDWLKDQTNSLFANLALFQDDERGYGQQYVNRMAINKNAKMHGWGDQDTMTRYQKAKAQGIRDGGPSGLPSGLLDSLDFYEDGKETTAEELNRKKQHLTSRYEQFENIKKAIAVDEKEYGRLYDENTECERYVELITRNIAKTKSEIAETEATIELLSEDEGNEVQIQELNARLKWLNSKL